MFRTHRDRQVPRDEDRTLVSKNANKSRDSSQKQKNLRESSKPLFDEWIKRPELINELSSKTKPLDGLQLHLPLDEGASDFVHLTAGGVALRKAIPAGAAWADGYIARQAWLNAEAGKLSTA